MAIKNTEEKPKTPRKLIAKTTIGIVFLVIGLILSLSFVSYFFNGIMDQSQISDLLDKNVNAENIFGKFGALLAEFFILQGIGIVAFFVPIFFILLGLKVATNWKKIKPFTTLYQSIFFLIWLPVFFGSFFPNQHLLCGVMGFEINDFLNSFIGKWGVILLLLVSLLIYCVIHFKMTYESIQEKLEERARLNEEKKIQKEEQRIRKEEIELRKRKEKEEQEKINKFNKEQEQNEKDLLEDLVLVNEENPELIDEPIGITPNEAFQQEFTINQPQEEESIEETPLNITPLVIDDLEEEIVEEELLLSKNSNSDNSNNLELKVQHIDEEEEFEATSNRLVQEQGEYDQRLDLPNYQFPPISLLKKYDNGNTLIDQKELETNKNRIIDTLGNYGIGISQITATIGPTVTLYEIVPQAGVRISKIKNLEDDIALSLSALGIRIIAPIPGKGTIGIEVPNSNPSMVSMHSVIASQKFQNCDMELPIAFGKTITNETFVADLAKMPHLLMAGATGQGKSVGLNAIIASLIYKKHPSELKFVMVDPKKVELTLYSKIERHYLAKLPDAEEAIITDNAKVINTLNSLCIEMDDRYELLKNAFVRNIKEYNAKFKARKLNPEHGHRFLPYIVLIVDEFADLIMTAGKEVELPIARLAQLARAVGIHLIVATQRPSVNVITGTIKANFPGRVAFRVTSKIDSRTILDSQGADQLIGKGDMLYTTGNELVRLQCAFVDTPEVDKITEFIGEQRGYPDALHLPEYVGEEGNSALDIDLSDRDVLFEDAARLIVMNQQGSASLLQRKLKLGYNRAGRLIDQLEAAGIVGPFEGSKARQVLVQDDVSLEQLLSNLN
ncbi:DNA translocase FtsK 4TM domain-containing protein [Chishuiella sp.]|uniref:DNA translocase FtsK 4TM domain-containing protein n=1 Tax=Chishuiella sp. TaxID=1969467 RepID=UPI0028AD3DD8|nr:DNA translocase FtsK 4TM domain-containing protein [Chishuiella sp.]